MSRRIPRSFAFLDLCGFTQFMTEHGDDSAAIALTDIRTKIRQAAGHSAVRVCKWLGDGAMLVAADPERLVECLEEIWWRLEDQPHLKLRCGIATGDVLIFEGDDYIGSAVNIASRLCDLASPGEFVAPAICSARIIGRRDSVRLRGLDDPLDVVRCRGLQ
jgi:class 3 adenylate cyclase